MLPPRPGGGRLGPRRIMDCRSFRLRKPGLLPRGPRQPCRDSAHPGGLVAWAEALSQAGCLSGAWEEGSGWGAGVERAPALKRLQLVQLPPCLPLAGRKTRLPLSCLPLGRAFSYTFRLNFKLGPRQLSSPTFLVLGTEGVGGRKRGWFCASGRQRCVCVCVFIMCTRGRRAHPLLILVSHN